VSDIETELNEALAKAEKALLGETKRAEKATEGAIDAQEAVVNAAQQAQRLQAALAALKGTVVPEIPLPATPSPAAPTNLAPPIIGAPVDPNDPLASRSTDFGAAPPPGESRGDGQLATGMQAEEGYNALPRPPPPPGAGLLDSSGQPMRKRRDNPQAMAQQQINQGPQCPGCGKHGTISNYQKELNDRMFMFVGCGSCGHERMIG